MTIKWKSIDGELGIKTQDRRMEGTDDTLSYGSPQFQMVLHIILLSGV